MKKEYTTPEMVINEFDTEDVITTSITGNSDGTVELPPVPIKQ